MSYTPFKDYLPALVAHFKAQSRRDIEGYAQRPKELKLAGEIA